VNAEEIAKDVARWLQGRDDIAETKVASPTTMDSSIAVRTQGGVLYEVRVIQRPEVK
jgi:hypothetical protein